MVMKHIIWGLMILVLSALLNLSCKKDSKYDSNQVQPSSLLSLDSLVPSKRNIHTMEPILILAYTQGENITYKWSTNHGTLIEKDSSSIKYYACHSCIGSNIVECIVENEHGFMKDTLVIHVTYMK